MFKSNNILRFKTGGFTVLFYFYLFFTACSPTSNEDKRKVTCSAGCSSMSWGVSDETGSQTMSSTCTRSYVGHSYVETCTGTITYGDSGNSYEFDVVYDWPNCKITVEVKGVGKCSDQVNDMNIAKGCECEGINAEDLIIRDYVPK